MNNFPNNSFRKGITDGIPICLGYLSVSFAFGIYAVEKGLSVFQTTLISMTNVTSAGQLAAVPIIVEGGSLFALILVQFIINIRYALMSITLTQKIDKTVTLYDRFIISFINTDEVFGVASSQEGKVSRKYLYGLILMPYIGWSAGTFIGASFGNILPKIVTSALEIAIYGMFIAIVVPVSKKDKSVFMCVMLTVLLSCIFYYVPFLRNIENGLVIIICSVVSSLVFSFLSPVKGDSKE